MQKVLNLHLKMFSLIIISALLISSAHAVTVDLKILNPIVTVGETFTIDVDVNNVFDGLDPFEEVLAFGYDTSISDPALVSFLGATVAPPFSDNSSLFPDTDVAGSVFPGLINDGTNDSITLATLSFQALNPGDASLGISSDISDFNEGLVYFIAGNSNISSSINVRVEPIPEPSTYALFAMGCFCSVIAYKKRKKS